MNISYTIFNNIPAKKCLQSVNIPQKVGQKTNGNTIEQQKLCDTGRALRCSKILLFSDFHLKSYKHPIPPWDYFQSIK